MAHPSYRKSSSASPDTSASAIRAAASRRSGGSASAALARASAPTRRRVSLAPTTATRRRARRARRRRRGRALSTLRRRRRPTSVASSGQRCSIVSSTPIRPPDAASRATSWARPAGRELDGPPGAVDLERTDHTHPCPTAVTRRRGLARSGPSCSIVARSTNPTDPASPTVAACSSASAVSRPATARSPRRSTASPQSSVVRHRCARWHLGRRACALEKQERLVRVAPTSRQRARCEQRDLSQLRIDGAALGGSRRGTPPRARDRRPDRAGRRPRRGTRCRRVLEPLGRVPFDLGQPRHAAGRVRLRARPTAPGAMRRSLASSRRRWRLRADSPRRGQPSRRRGDRSRPGPRIGRRRSWHAAARPRSRAPSRSSRHRNVSAPRP